MEINQNTVDIFHDVCLTTNGSAFMSNCSEFGEHYVPDEIAPSRRKSGKELVHFYGQLKEQNTSMPVVQSMAPWAGNQKGQTLDSVHSFASVEGDETGTIILFGHLYRTNQLNAQLQVYYKLDGSAPVQTGVNFQTNNVGTGDFAYSVGGFTPGSTHTIVIEINTAPGAGLTYYVNAAASSDASTGISFTIATPPV